MLISPSEIEQLQPFLCLHPPCSLCRGLWNDQNYVNVNFCWYYVSIAIYTDIRLLSRKVGSNVRIKWFWKSKTIAVKISLCGQKPCEEAVVSSLKAEWQTADKLWSTPCTIMTRMGPFKSGFDPCLDKLLKFNKNVGSSSKPESTPETYKKTTTGRAKYLPSH